MQEMGFPSLPDCKAFTGRVSGKQTMLHNIGNTGETVIKLSTEGRKTWAILSGYETSVCLSILPLQEVGHVCYTLDLEVGTRGWVKCIFFLCSIGCS